MAKIKADRVSEEFKRVISELITNEVNDERVKGKCTVMYADVTTDLSYCKVGVSVMGDDKDKEKAMEGLTHAKGYIKTRLAEIIDARKIPELIFILDTSIDHSIKISEIIDSFNKDDKK